MTLYYNQIHCGYCGKIVTKKTGQRRTRYCNNACKQAAYRCRQTGRLTRAQIIERRARLAATRA